MDTGSCFRLPQHLVAPARPELSQGFFASLLHLASVVSGRLWQLDIREAAVVKEGRFEDVMDWAISYMLNKERSKLDTCCRRENNVQVVVLTGLYHLEIDGSTAPTQSFV